MKIQMLALFALVPSVAAIAVADPLPKPIEGLEALVGSWKGTGQMAMGKDKANVDLTLGCKRTSAKFGVECQFTVKGIPGVALYEETDLFGYEPGSDTYHWFSVTNAGETHDHVAKAGDFGKIQFAYNGTQEGKPMKEVIDLEFAKDARSFSFRTETFVAGQSVAVLTAKGHK